MKYMIGDEVTVLIMGKQRDAVVVYTYPETREYQVSVDHGAGGFHILAEDQLTRKEVR